MRRLPSESDEEYVNFIKSDIKNFDDLFYRLTGDKPTIFAYPYGIKNDHLPQILGESGYKIILTSGERVNKLSVGSPLTEIGRFNRPHGISSDTFFKKLFPIAIDSSDVYN